MTLYIKQKKTHKPQNQTYGYQRGAMGKSDKLRLYMGLIYTYYHV